MVAVVDVVVLMLFKMMINSNKFDVACCRRRSSNSNFSYRMKRGSNREIEGGGKKICSNNILVRDVRLRLLYNITRNV